MAQPCIFGALVALHQHLLVSFQHIVSGLLCHCLLGYCLCCETVQTNTAALSKRGFLVHVYLADMCLCTGSQGSRGVVKRCQASIVSSIVTVVDLHTLWGCTPSGG